MQFAGVPFSALKEILQKLIENCAFQSVQQLHRQLFVTILEVDY